MISRTDVTDRFHRLRDYKQQQRKNRRQYILNQYKLIRYSNERDSNNRLLKSFNKKVYYDVDEQVIDINTYKSCELCQKKFSFFGKKRVQCPLCRSIVCQDCNGNTISIKSPGSGNLDICRLCFKVLKHRKALDKFKMERKNASKSRLSIWYNTMSTIRSHISRQMPRFRGIVYCLTGIDGDTETMRNEHLLVVLDGMEMETVLIMKNEACEIMVDLDANFKNLQSRLAKLIRIECNSDTEMQVLMNIKYSTNTFLTSNLPEFNNMGRNLMAFLESPEFNKRVERHNKQLLEKKREEKLRERAEREKKRWEEQYGEPFPTIPRPDEEIQKPIATNVPPTEPVQKQSERENKLISSVFGIFKPNTHGTNSTTDTTNMPLVEDTVEVQEIQDTKPNIKLVKPAILSCNGGIQITIQGRNFMPGIQVVIGDIVVGKSFVELVNQDGRESLIVDTPPHDVGPVSIILINPDDQEVTLEGVLYYTDDESLFEEVFV
eukprot:TRINITY_DN9870_c0_g1_i1.p1 TRINITY_DN9870_c0_g1~~TRINITY_DN9870_c0_g1_i1.p1  ORF type:complete len:491 (-),score=76.84 TRINITY_DN9870_c0_g1_i1:37-1509(-)